MIFSKDNLAKIIILILVTSNLFLIAFLVSYKLSDETVCVDRRLTLASLAQSLPPADKRRFSAELKLHEAEYRASLAQLRKSRASLDMAIIAVDFDMQEASTRFSNWKQSLDEFINTFGSILISATSKVSPEGRRSLVDTFPAVPRCK